MKPFVENTKLEFRSNNPAFIDRLYFFFIVYQIFAAYLKAELFYIDCNYLQGRIIIYWFMSHKITHSLGEKKEAFVFFFF